MPTTFVEAREYRRNLQTDFSTILQPTFQACVAMAKKIKNLALYFFPRNQFRESMVPRLT